MEEPRSRFGQRSLHFCSRSAAPQFGQVPSGRGSAGSGVRRGISSRSVSPDGSIGTMMRLPAPGTKRYLAAGVAAGGGVAGTGVVELSIFNARPAGVRRASIGVVSGVGGGAAGAVPDAAWPSL